MDNNRDDSGWLAECFASLPGEEKREKEKKEKEKEKKNLVCRLLDQRGRRKKKIKKGGPKKEMGEKKNL